MKNQTNPMKHNKPYPSVREIRRACSKELYRARKKINRWISPELVDQAEKLYFKKVALNLQFVVENASNRKLLADWFEENVCGEIAALWDVEPEVLAKAFRDSFGG